MRGKVFAELVLEGYERITPACAGKRLRYPVTAIISQDHPRMCGEKYYKTPHCRFLPGSPPHVRGKAIDLQTRHIRRGITPACAGKSQNRRYGLRKGKDHPRMCGEKSFSARAAARSKGSPPHVRGKDERGCHDGGGRRITPACAGKSPTPSCYLS